MHASLISIGIIYSKNKSVIILVLLFVIWPALEVNASPFSDPEKSTAAGGGYETFSSEQSLNYIDLMVY